MIKRINDALASRRHALAEDEGQKGFTLIELLVVVAIIAILAAIAIPIYLGQQDNARNSAVQGALQTVQQQVSSKTVGDNGEAVAVNQTTLNSIISDAGYDPASSKKVQITGTVTGTGAATTYTLTGTYGNATDNKFTIDQNGKIS